MKFSDEVVKDAVRSGYSKEGGEEYHSAVHSKDDFILSTIAKQRAYKLQPFVSNEDDLLEFGSGLGVNLRYLKCRSRFGFDASDAGQDLHVSNGINFTTDITEVESKKFSAVLCHHVLEHVPDPIQVLSQINNFLIPGGRLILCVPNEFSSLHRRYNPNDPNRHIFSWSVQSLGNLVSTVGFTVELVENRPFGYEQRLSFLAKGGFKSYQLGLWFLRKVIPCEEVILIARKPMEN